MNALEVLNLTKIYEKSSKTKSVVALKDFSLNVQKGTIFGLLGPNGAGKTTLIKVLLGIAGATSGEAKIFGEDIGNYRIRERIGYLPENHRFPNYLNAEEVLKTYARLSNYTGSDLDSKIDYLLTTFHLEKWKKTKIKKYSKGMLQRLGLAQAVINDPEILFLDEPTDGVDPIGRKEIRDFLLELKAKGKTIFINSHLLSEVERVSDRVAILNKGVLLREGTVEELTTEKEIYEFTFADNVDFDILSQVLGINSLDKKNGSYSVKVENTDELNALIDKIRGKGINIISLVQKKNSLEEKFISVIKNEEK